MEFTRLQMEMGAIRDLESKLSTLKGALCLEHDTQPQTKADCERIDMVKEMTIDMVLRAFRQCSQALGRGLEMVGGDTAQLNYVWYAKVKEDKHVKKFHLIVNGLNVSDFDVYSTDNKTISNVFYDHPIELTDQQVESATGWKFSN